MIRKQMKEFGEIFNLGQGYFNPRGASLSRDDFMEDVRNMQLDF